MEKPVPCPTETIMAVWMEGQVTIIASGKYPTPGYAAFWIKLLIDIFPPQYRIMRATLPGIYPPAEEPFNTTISFEAASPPQTVIVYDADGEKVVDVIDIG